VNTTASYNTAVGFLAGEDNTTGTLTAVGAYALGNNTTGTSNVAVGGYDGTTPSALRENTTGNRNTAVGVGALRSNTTGSSNTAVGYQAMYTATAGAGDNICIGYQSGFTTNAGNNTLIGSQAGRQITTGSGNTIIGQYAGRDNTTGADNTFIGRNSGYQITTGSNNSILGMYNGNQGGIDIRTSSNNIVLSDGDGNVRARFTSGGDVFFSNGLPVSSTVSGIDFSGGTAFPYIRISSANDTASRYKMEFYNGNGVVGRIITSGTSTAYNTSSDYRLKENVVDMTGAIDRVKQLSPKRFNFIADADTTVDGFLAHEAQAVVAESVQGTHNEVDDDGNPVMQGIDQSKLVPLLTGALKEAIAKIEDLEARIATLEGE
jgi:hypothetical protein